MENLPNDKILQFQPDTLQFVRKLYGFDKLQDLNNAIDILDEWIKQQNHFTKKDFKREHLERMIITSKGSVERAKSRLDKICTLRSLAPNFFLGSIQKDYDTIDGALFYAPMPKLTKDHERVYAVNCVGDKFQSKFISGFRIVTVQTEYLKYHDYATSYIFVVDYRDCNIAAASSNMNVFELRQLVTIIMEGHGLRIKAIYFLTNSTLIDILVSLLRQTVSEKIGNRIHVVKTLEALHEQVPKELLPKDVGGSEPSIKELHETWKGILTSEEFSKFWDDICSARTDEAFRQKDTFNEKYMGMPGTFRALSVD